MRDKIIEIIAAIKDDFSTTVKISDHLDLINDVGLDSLQMINFMLKLEDEFDIEIDFDDLDYDNMRSLNRLETFLEQQIN